MTGRHRLQRVRGTVTIQPNGPRCWPRLAAAGGAAIPNPRPYLIHSRTNDDTFIDLRPPEHQLPNDLQRPAPWTPRLLAALAALVAMFAAGYVLWLQPAVSPFVLIAGATLTNSLLVLYAIRRYR